MPLLTLKSIVRYIYIYLIETYGFDLTRIISEHIFKCAQSAAVG